MTLRSAVFFINTFWQGSDLNFILGRLSLERLTFCGLIRPSGIALSSAISVLSSMVATSRMWLLRLEM